MNSELFYDNFTKKLISDYLSNNVRMASALKMVLSNISLNSKKILDIGCGIGWSTHEIANSLKNSHVHGIDLSSNSIKAANTLFKLDNNEFSKSDVTKDIVKNNDDYDTIVMIDVLEHIPQNERIQFNDSLSRIMTKDARFIVSCPTIYHQEYLRTKNPEGLQPVDEDITISILSEIADKLDGDITYFSYTSIWNTNDYLYAVIQRNTEYKPFVRNTQKQISLEDINKRVERIRNSTYKELFNDEELYNFKIKPESLKAKIKRFVNG